MKMSKPILYHIDTSPPSRFALITARHIGLDVEVRDVDLYNLENLSSEFKEINPTGTVPALLDGDTKIFDSSAITIYMVEKYAKDDSLYPKDLIERTKVNERLFYVSSYIFPRIYQIFVPGYDGSETEIPQEKIDGIIRGYETLEKFLEGSDYLASNTLQLCDLSLWTQMASLALVIPVDNEKFPKFTAWLERMNEHPQSSFNKQSADTHIKFYRDCIKIALASKEN